MAQPLLIPYPENATIQELKQVSRISSSETATRCTAIQIERTWLTMKARWFNNHVCKNEEQLLERLDQAILDVIYNPLRTQKTAAIGTLL
jgi:hypothetical protein